MSVRDAGHHAGGSLTDRCEHRARLFLAARPAEPAIQLVAAQLEPRIARALAGVRWLDPAHWHITLRFLGAWPARSLAELREACVRCARDAPPVIDLTLDRVGAFPTATVARVLWIGAHDPSGALGTLAAALEREVTALDAAPETRPFHAHLTVARLGRPRDLRALIDAPVWSPVATRVDSLLLYESRTLPSGAHYEVRGAWSLGEGHGLGD